MIAGTRRHLGPKVRGLRHCELNSVANAQLHQAIQSIKMQSRKVSIPSFFGGAR